MKSFSLKHRKNTSEIRGRSKKKNQSKKRRRDSSSDEDWRSDSSLSYSSCDSADDVRVRRTRTRRDSKKIRKRSRRSASPQVRVSTHRSMKKLLGKQKNAESEKKKNKKKKKRSVKGKRGQSRRNRSVSSASSVSCSTCSDSSTSDGESESDRLRKLEGKGPRDRSGKGERKRGRSRRRSHSCSNSGRSGGEIEYERSRKLERKGLRGERSGRRGRYQSLSLSPSRSLSSSPSRCRGFVFERSHIRSVSIGKRSERIERRDRVNENKADIIQAFEDYPSSRSNDSNDGRKKRESRQPHTHHELEDRWMGGDESAYDCEKVDAKREKVLRSEVTIRDSVNSDAQCGQIDPGSNETLMEKKNEVSATDHSSEIDDLEAILRQKALENFAKFRNSLVRNAKAVGDEKDRSGASKQSVENSAPIQIEPHDGAGNKTKALQDAQNVKNAGISIDGRSVSSLEGNRSFHERSHPQESKSKFVSHALADIDSLPSACSIPTEENIKNIGNSRSISSASTFGQKCSGDQPNMVVHGIRSHVEHAKTKLDGDHSNSDTLSPLNKNQDIPKEVSQEPSSRSLSDIKTVPDRKVLDVLKGTPGSSNVHEVGESGPGPSSTFNLETDKQASSELKVETQSGSQLEQRTMSVMRGGEMVQVSYKVYIPKKSPALARRQLQR